MLLGFNNFAFDDHLIIHHIRDKCEDVQITDVRRTLFSSDLKSIMKSKTSLTNEAETLKISTEGAHDGLEDCKLIIDVMTRKYITTDQVKNCSRSFESVINKRNNPLLRSGLIISQTVLMNCHFRSHTKSTTGVMRTTGARTIEGYYCTMYMQCVVMLKFIIL